MKKSKVYSVSDEKFIELVKSNKNYSDILRSLGLTPRGGSSSKVLKRRIDDLKIDLSHLQHKAAKASLQRTIKLELILVKNSNYTSIATLKRRLIRQKIIEYKCSICGNIGEWCGKKLSLQLDHINGKSNDHRIENLRFLCPNCHSQTKTYAGRNKNCLSGFKS